MFRRHRTVRLRHLPAIAFGEKRHTGHSEAPVGTTGASRISPSGPPAVAAVTARAYDGTIRGSEAPIEKDHPMCPHSIRRDFRYMPWAGERQCRYCGATQSQREAQDTPSESPSSFIAA